MQGYVSYSHLSKKSTALQYYHISKRNPAKCAIIEKAFALLVETARIAESPIMEDGMKEKVLRFIENEGIAAAIILFTIFCFWIPFIPKGMVAGSEIDFQYARILTLIQCLQIGIFPGKLRPMHMKGYGYGVGFFYPDFFVYPSAIAGYLGIDPEIATKGFTLLVIIIATFVIYRLFRKLSSQRTIALVGVILVIGSRINYDNFIEGAGFPHLYAYLFMPLAIIGLLNIFKGDKKGYLEYFIGLTLVVLSHHLIFLTMLFTMVIIVLCHVKKIIENPKAFGKLFGVSLVALSLTTAYWLPAIEQASKIKLIALYDNSYDITEHILSLRDVVLEHIGIPMFSMFTLAAIAYVVMRIKGKAKDTDILSLFVANCIILIVTCSKALWLGPFGQVFGFFQYTERFIFVMTVIMIIFVVMVMRELYNFFSLSKLSDKKTNSVLTVLILVALIIATRCDNKLDFYNVNSYYRKQLTYDLLEEKYNVSGAEWLPIECEPSECKTPNTSKADDGSGADGFKHDNCKYYEVWIDMTKKYYDVPYVYYYGYKAYLVDENMAPFQELEVGEAFDDNGYVRVFLPEDGMGIAHMMVTYRKTTVQKISYVVSLLTAIAILIVFVCKKRKNLR